MVENKIGLRLKCLRFDNGGEYIDRGFKEYCATNGIRMEKTIPRTPQQNGIAERMNRTINQLARSMRLHSRLPKAFWADAVNTTVYLINRGLSVLFKYSLLKEVWSEKEVKLAHLKVFDCISYVLKSNDRSKLDAKATRCFFIGYEDEQFGYWFWDNQKQKIIRSKNVVFDEKVLYKYKSSGDLEGTVQENSKFVSLDIPKYTP